MTDYLFFLHTFVMHSRGPVPRSTSKSVTRGSSSKLTEPLYSNHIMKYFFTNRVIDVWYCLIDDVVILLLLASLVSLKRKHLL